MGGRYQPHVLTSLKQKSHSVSRVAFVGPTGFEPIYTVPKTVVLPLDDGPMLVLKRTQK